MPGFWAYRRHLPYLQKAHATYFVTFSTKGRRPLPPAARDVVLACCRHLHERTAFLHAAGVMPEHVHLVLTPLAGSQSEPVLIERILKGLKGTSARRINQSLCRRGPLWQGESFDHVLRCSESAQEKVEYLVANPVRRGLVRQAQEYAWLWRAVTER